MYFLSVLVSVQMQLLQRFEKKNLPPLPGKTLTGRKFAESHTDQRAQKLNDYLMVLANNPRVAKSDVWGSFLAGSFDDLLFHAQTAEDQLRVRRKSNPLPASTPLIFLLLLLLLVLSLSPHRQA